MDPYFFGVEIKVDDKIYGLLLWSLRDFPQKDSAWSLSSCHIMTPDDRDDGRWWEFLKCLEKLAKGIFEATKNTTSLWVWVEHKWYSWKADIGCGALTSHEKNPKMYLYHGIPLVYTSITMSDLEKSSQNFQTFFRKTPQFKEFGSISGEAWINYNIAGWNMDPEGRCIFPFETWGSHRSFGSTPRQPSGQASRICEGLASRVSRSSKHVIVRWWNCQHPGGYLEDHPI